jgi:hypothetical protein
MFEEVGRFSHQRVDVLAIFVLHYNRVKQEIAPIGISFPTDCVDDFVGSVG